MDISRDQLAANFRSMTDEALLARQASGTLTGLAQTVIEQVLGERGIPVPAPAVAVAASAATQVESTDLVLAAKFLTATEAFLVRGLLESEGVPALVADAHIVQNNELLAIAVGGVRVLVAEDGLARAHEIIAAFRRGAYALDDGATYPG